MARIPRPKTKLIRVRISDAEKLKILARQSQKQLPDYITELLRRNKAIRRKI